MKNILFVSFLFIGSAVPILKNLTPSQNNRYTRSYYTCEQKTLQFTPELARFALEDWKELMDFKRDFVHPNASIQGLSLF